MKTNRITLVSLAVRDLEKSKAFYAALGWEIEEGPPEAAFYRMGQGYFGLYKVEKLAEDIGRSPAELGSGMVSLAQNFATEAEVDAAYARALAAGGVQLSAPETVFWGGYSGTWADPDGHIWEYAMNPFWELDADGHLT